MKLKFDAATHTYRLGKRIIPSVTQIIKAAGMIDTTYFTPEATERGSAVHAAIDMLLDNDLDWETMDSRVLPYVEAFNAFWVESNLILEHTEQMVYCKTFNYCGRFDIIGLLNGRRVLIDIKTGVPQPWVAAQTAAYQIAAEPIYGLIAKRFCLILSADGKYKLVEHKFGYSEWLNALTIFREKNNGTGTTGADRA
jgi:hypothetical protein